MICPVCGRNAERLHCPDCGSYSTTGLKPRRDANGRAVKVLRCRKCGRVYQDGEPCTAPTLVLKTELREVERKLRKRSEAEDSSRKAVLDRLFSNPKVVEAARALARRRAAGEAVVATPPTPQAPSPLAEPFEGVPAEEADKLKNLF